MQQPNSPAFNNNRMLLFLGGVFVVLLLTCGIVGSIANAMEHGGDPGINAALAPVPTATRAPTATSAPVATATPAPTATATLPSVPTATPKPLTRKQVAQQLVQKGINESEWSSAVKSWSVESDDKAKSFTITITLDTPLDQSAAEDEMRYLAYYIEKDMYTSGKMSINDVDVAFSGPLVDKYGKTFTGAYGYADLTFKTAQMFVWGNLTPEQAWDAYDDQGMR